MLKTFTVMAALACGSPALAQSGAFVSTNDAVNGMMQDWAEYDSACRGTYEDQGRDGFCGAREYLSFALQREGVCLGEDENLGLFFRSCAAGDYEFADPLAEVRKDF